MLPRTMRMAKMKTRQDREGFFATMDDLRVRRYDFKQVGYDEDLVFSPPPKRMTTGGKNMSISWVRSGGCIKPMISNLIVDSVLPPSLLQAAAWPCE